MVSVAEYLDELRKDVGYTESPPNSNCNKFSHELGKPCEPWCADFLVAGAVRKGLDVPHTSYTPEMARQFKARHQWIIPEHIKAGDFVFYDFPDEHNRIQHVECALTAVVDGKIAAVGGNTSSDNHGSQFNGGGVFVRSRPLKYIVGAGRPDYTEGHVSALTPDEHEWLATANHFVKVLYPQQQEQLNRIEEHLEVLNHGTQFTYPVPQAVTLIHKKVGAEKP